MKQIYYFLFFAFSTNYSFGQTNYLVENFDYPADALLTANGWFAHSAGTTNPLTVNSGGLSLTTTPYIGSGVGNAALVDNTGSDENKPLEGYLSAGSVYASFLFKANAPLTTANDGFFFHFVKYSDETTPDFTSTNTAFRARVFVIPGTTDAQFKFGLTFNATSEGTDVTTDLDVTQTYLVVAKYTFVDGDDNDTVSLYVFSDGQSIVSEPATPTIGPLTGTAADIGIIQGVALRQFAATQNNIVDGIYVRNEWNLTSSGTSLSATSFEDNKFTLSPNPVTENKFTINTIAEGPKTVTLFDINGRKMLEKVMETNSVDVSSLSKGFYIVQLTIDNKVQTSKLIIK
jgi:hypothetical protein